MTPRKHAELIKAWADGAEIQVFLKNSDCWLTVLHPQWLECEIYRIKPVPKAKKVEIVK